MFSCDQTCDGFIITMEHIADMVPGQHPVKVRATLDQSLQALSEETLIVSIKVGRTDLVRELVRRHSDRLLLIILRMVQSRSSAEDILQETWIKFLGSIKRVDPGRPIMPWLTRIALNCCRDHLRKERIRSLWARGEGRRQTLVIIGKGDHQQVGPGFEQVDLDRGLQSLSTKLRAVVVLKFYSGLMISEIADILGIPEGTVKSRLNKALRRLRQFFEVGEERS